LSIVITEIVCDVVKCSFEYGVTDKCCKPWMPVDERLIDIALRWSRWQGKVGMNNLKSFDIVLSIKGIFSQLPVTDRLRNTGFTFFVYRIE